MRPPFIEAAVLLAAHGHALAPPVIRRPAMPAGERYAVFPTPDRPSEPGRTFAALDKLAAHIHRVRRDQAIQCVDAPLQLAGDAAPRKGVSVWTLTDTGERRDYLGWCYLGGSGQRTLEAALFALRPQLADVAQ
ncbi:hypothetical protein [uncultured Brevundimonas sp.]|uniref:hypothetical protein n=1 Tax=uncultured Brevundimonas sp. TaxID=213418 RepID=UPI0025EDDA94|nr:hypothetical protein [uncultured Brevundimonas sp.]